MKVGIGNPNVGKSLIFHQLTGLGVEVSNYPGTTIDLQSGTTCFHKEIIEVTDLPGTYSIEGDSEEEKIVRSFVDSGEADVIVAVLDGKIHSNFSNHNVWLGSCMLFLYVDSDTSLNVDILTLIMVGLISASRIAAHWNEKLAEDIMKFLPFNLLFTLLLNPNLDFDKIIDAVHNFPSVMLELTIFIAFLGILEAILKLIYFTVRKIRNSFDKGNLPIEPS